VSLSRTAIAAYLALVFACGAVLGVFGDRFYSVYTGSTVARSGQKGPKMSPEEFTRHRFKVLQDRLRLTDSQLTQIHLIYDETRALYEEQRKRSLPELQKITKDQQEKILKLLNEDQRGEYEKILKEDEDRRRRPGPGGPRGGF